MVDADYRWWGLLLALLLIGIPFVLYGDEAAKSFGYSCLGGVVTQAATYRIGPTRS